MNCLILEWDGEFVLIDCGIQFPDARFPGVDILTPDLSYVIRNQRGLRGIVITHAHEDHIGGIPYLAASMDLDVYCTSFPEGLIRAKLQEKNPPHEVRFHHIEPRTKFKVGPFEFDPIRVQHSIIESLAFAIETPIGRMVHTGDFKHDANELGGECFGFEAFEELGKQGVHLLLSDSTNAERSGHTLSELDITQSFEKFFAEQTGRLFIALFASNIRRVENLMHLAHASGKKIVLVGRSMHSYTRLAHEQNSMRLPPETLVLSEHIDDYPDDKVVVLLTGSQAEPQSALVRIAAGTHRDIKLRSTDRVILSSRFIPGNERAITGMIDQLYRMGADVIYEDVHQIHVSGHGFQDELSMMLQAIKPKFFVPIHGEFRHMAKHGKLAVENGVAAENVFVIENGHILEFDKLRGYRREVMPMFRGIVVDGGFMDGPPDLFTSRINLSKTGIVYVSLLRDARNGKLIAAPRVSAYGLLLNRELSHDTVLMDAEDFIEDLYAEIRNQSDLEDALRLEVRRFFKKRASHKPIVVPVILDI